MKRIPMVKVFYPVYTSADAFFVRNFVDDCKAHGLPVYDTVDGIYPEMVFDEEIAAKTAVALLFCIKGTLETDEIGTPAETELIKKLESIVSFDIPVLAIVDKEKAIPKQYEPYVLATVAYTKAKFRERLEAAYEYVLSHPKKATFEDYGEENYSLFSALGEDPLDYRVERPEVDLRIPLGLKEDLTPLEVNLKQEKHVIIWGHEETGRTRLLLNAATALLRRNGTDHIRFAVFDPNNKITDVFSNLPCLFNNAIPKTQQELWDQIYDLEDLMHERLKKIDEVDFHWTIEDWNKNREEKMDYIICFVDDLKWTQLEDGAGIVAISGATVGIHFIVTSDRLSPDYDYPTKVHVLGRDKHLEVRLKNNEKHTLVRPSLSEDKLQSLFCEYKKCFETEEDFQEIVDVARKQKDGHVTPLCFELELDCDHSFACYCIRILRALGVISCRRDIEQGYRVLR